MVVIYNSVFVHAGVYTCSLLYMHTIAIAYCALTRNDHPNTKHWLCSLGAYSSGDAAASSGASEVSAASSAGASAASSLGVSSATASSVGAASSSAGASASSGAASVASSGAAAHPPT